MDGDAMMNSPPSPSLNTPPRSRKSSRSKSPALSIDIPSPPALIEPSPPSNTLIVTNINDPKVFASSTVARLRTLIDHSLENAMHVEQPRGAEQLTPDDTLHSLSPLPSLRRMILTFTTTAAAFYIRAILDGTTLGSGDRIRVFFGADTPLNNKDPYLQAPKSSKQFFISPPPSPPAGWTMRDEDPPNKQVHPDDLLTALGKIGKFDDEEPEHVAPAQEPPRVVQPPRAVPPTINTNIQPVRTRSDSLTIVYNPEELGHSPDLPAISVEDTTDSPTAVSPADLGRGKLMAHTSRPPVELMDS